MNTPAQDTLATLKAQIALFHPDESQEIYDLVDKLNQVISHYQSSAKLAMMIVCLETSIKEGAMKPRLTIFTFPFSKLTCWACCGDGFMQLGMTPTEAYNNWKYGKRWEPVCRILS